MGDDLEDGQGGAVLKYVTRLSRRAGAVVESRQVGEECSIKLDRIQQTGNSTSDCFNWHMYTYKLSVDKGKRSILYNRLCRFQFQSTTLSVQLAMPTQGYCSFWLVTTAKTLAIYSKLCSNLRTQGEPELAWAIKIAVWMLL